MPSIHGLREVACPLAAFGGSMRPCKNSGSQLSCDTLIFELRQPVNSCTQTLLQLRATESNRGGSGYETTVFQLRLHPPRPVSKIPDIAHPLTVFTNPGSSLSYDHQSTVVQLRPRPPDLFLRYQIFHILHTPRPVSKIQDIPHIAHPLTAFTS